MSHRCHVSAELELRIGIKSVGANGKYLSLPNAFGGFGEFWR